MIVLPASPAARWAFYAAWSLCLVRSPADVEQWRRDNARYLERIRDRYPNLHAELEQAIGRTQTTRTPAAAGLRRKDA